MNTLTQILPRQDLIDQLCAKKGVIRTISYRRDLKFRAAYAKLGYFGEKITSGQFFVGQNYENKAIIKEGRENGQLPETPQPLMGLEWEIFPFILRNKEGKLYARLYPVHNNQFTTRFFINGNESNIQAIEEFCVGSELGGNEARILVNVALDNILIIK